MFAGVISRTVFKSLSFASLALLAAIDLPAQTASAPVQSAIQANSNRVPAGRLQYGVLTLHLELRQGDWYPEADAGPSTKVYAFGEEGRALQVPGPLIRVPEGTEIRLTIRNLLPVSAVVHGLHQHPGDINDVVQVPREEQREVNFTAGSAGTYQYWATAGGDLFRGRPYKEDSQLAGAFVVDPPGAPPDDRVFVIGLWQTKAEDDSEHNIAVINGKSWPYTERLTYEAGKPARWRWINGSHWPHPMHMHGSYYRVDSAGDGERDEIFQWHSGRWSSPVYCLPVRRCQLSGFRRRDDGFFTATFFATSQPRRDSTDAQTARREQHEPHGRNGSRHHRKR